ncbi:hypothetical protein SPSIL_025040 [Sporomusa silvacetica DSM 10669]|uniref:UPF0235 protein SPSIL_025040 n=1 Tax=Sporomusa silvacetica DSM 10669 TaxID=1123289 RepID=A0ABZ3IKY7_9FIRM|nr:DUF167 domain-containing protein [Sporomusa silvacetica]OZC23733.1 hypothetical protein SPSIL_01350 [Sporomusa silvacetica DSM 10669]
MSDNLLDIRELPDGIAFKVRVQPRASKNMVVGIMGDCLKIKLTSPPVDGAANAACIAFIASILDVAKSSVVIINGQNNRLKVIKVTGIDKKKFFTMLCLDI